jgi:hypothetical protein
MPSTGSWNGRWSGEGRNFVRVRQLTDSDTTALLGVGWPKGSWFHRWDDGWGALVTARVMERGERKPKSDGFCGYDWMIDNIINYGSPYTTGTSEGMVGAVR